MMPMFGIDGDLSGGAERDLIAGNVVGNVDDGEGAATGCPCADIHECSRCLELAGGDRVDDEANLGLEDPAGDRIECDFGLVARSYALKGILLKRGS